jgi:LmbE family N-acetylglucosaminyl deacetylase
VIVTFGPNGSNGHPDHVCTHHRVREALERCDHCPEALYYFASATPYQGSGRPGFLDPEEIRALQLFATHHVPVGPTMATKLRAMGHHRSQALSVVTFMRDLADRLVSETFHRADPPFFGAPILDAEAL